MHRNDKVKPSYLMTKQNVLGHNWPSMPFIVFEGLDGSGKSSLMDRLERFLKNQNKVVHRTREPGGTSLGDEIRYLILRNEGPPPHPRAELLLYEASRAQHVEEFIKPKLAKNEWVLSDRFAASSIAFQAGGRAISEADVQALNLFATGGVQPDLTILLDISVEKAHERRTRREKTTGVSADRIEKESYDFHERVRQSFIQQAQENKSKWIILNADKTLEQLMLELTYELKEKGWSF
jgi:dTMP kinase